MEMDTRSGLCDGAARFERAAGKDEPTGQQDTETRCSGSRLCRTVRSGGQAVS